MQRVIIAFGVGIWIGASNGACLQDAHEACHRREMARLGCCPFCEDDCAASKEEIDDACADQLDDLLDEKPPDDGDGSGSAAPSERTERSALQ